MTDVDSLPAEGLSLLSTLSQEAGRLEQEIAAAEAALVRLKTAHEEVVTKRLPDAMNDLFLKKIQLADGAEIAVKTEYHASIPKAQQAAAFQYLRERGYGDIIKNELTLLYSRGEEERAVEVFNALRAAEPDRPITLAARVHSGTLKALVKEQHESGEPLPESTFGIFIINRAIIKRS